EMAHSGDLIVTTIHYKPDMWNTKPPLMIWAQALCIKIFGMGEWAVRLPAALAAALTAILLFVVILRVTGNGWAALLAAIVLCTSQGYIGFHGARFGEYDSLLALLTTGYLLCFFFHIESPPGRAKNMFVLGFFFLLALAVLAKSIAGLLFGPALLLYALVRGQLITILRNKYAWLGFLGFIVLVAGYYLLREHSNPGYLKAVMENELGGRFMASNEGHKAPAGYYFSTLPHWRFPFWFWLLCVSMVLLPFLRAKWRWLSLYSVVSAVLFMGVLSLSKTKLSWYLLPIYPLFAIAIALAFARVAEWIPAAASRRFALPVLVGALSIYPLWRACEPINNRGISEINAPGFYNISEYLRDAARTGKHLDEIVFLTASDYDLHRQLYLRQLKETRNMDLRWSHLSERLVFEPGRRILVYEDRVKKFLVANYDYKVLEQDNNVLLCEIVNRKPQQP
ncbi:MAG: ArnT family glycosyltransferase, partial [Chthoniobacterales bacterium]